MIGGIIIKTGDVLLNILPHRPGALLYITENADWIIKRIGINLTTQLTSNHLLHARISTTFSGARNNILHFGSLNTFFQGPDCVSAHASNRTVLTVFHLPSQDLRIQTVVTNLTRIDRIHTASTITRQDLISHGIPPDKISLIPLGIDLKLFQPTTARENIRETLGLPNDKIIIGSFQKDGEGWDEGKKPKLIKGPDIFCKIVKEIAKVRPIHILLTGPARGFVKDNLSKNHIPFTHHYIVNYRELVKYYQALDIYFVTSRIEGGPMAILESMACGIPVISTPVGMAPDVIKNGVNGFICAYDNGNSEKYVNTALQIIGNTNLRDTLVNNALQTVPAFDWPRIAKRYYDLLYKNAL